MSEETRKIEVTVAFAASARPYHHAYAVAAPIGTVLDDALAAFAVTSDGTTRYYLVHKGDEVPSDKTVGEVAGRAHALQLKLRTELIQGAS